METGRTVCFRSQCEYNSDFRYTGDFGGGVKNGTGTLYFSNGDKRVGSTCFIGLIYYLYHNARLVCGRTISCTGLLLTILGGAGLMRRFGRRTTKNLRKGGNDFLLPNSTRITNNWLKCTKYRNNCVICKVSDTKH